MPFLFNDLKTTFAITIGAVPLQQSKTGTAVIARSIGDKMIHTASLPLTPTATLSCDIEPQSSRVTSKYKEILCYDFQNRYRMNFLVSNDQVHLLVLLKILNHN